MSNEYKEPESPVVSLKNESARQRWELFHRAIAHAKQSNDVAEFESEAAAKEPHNVVPFLFVVR